jgi:hypothetical protein
MPFQITNTSNGPVLIRLRSGATLRLVSGEQSPELEDPEVNDNPRLERLLVRHLITVREVTSRGGGARGAASATGTSGRSRRPGSQRGADKGASDAQGS